jgi:hypothetical protein
MLLGQNGGVDWDCNPFPPRIFFFRNDPFALTFALEVIEGESWRAEEKAATAPLTTEHSPKKSIANTWRAL